MKKQLKSFMKTIWGSAAAAAFLTVGLVFLFPKAENFFWAFFGFLLFSFEYPKWIKNEANTKKLKAYNDLQNQLKQDEDRLKREDEERSSTYMKWYKLLVDRTTREKLEAHQFQQFTIEGVKYTFDGIENIIEFGDSLFLIEKCDTEKFKWRVSENGPSFSIPENVKAQIILAHSKFADLKRRAEESLSEREISRIQKDAQESVTDLLGPNRYREQRDQINKLHRELELQHTLLVHEGLLKPDQDREDKSRESA